MTYGLWQRRFGGDTSLVGQPLELNGASYTFVGILPPSFFFPIPDAELAVPLVPEADPWRQNRNTVNFPMLVGRTRQGASAAYEGKEDRQFIGEHTVGWEAFRRGFSTFRRPAQPGEPQLVNSITCEITF
jgi:hypothetical protein